MKKALVILLILSFCGGADDINQNEPTSNQVSEKTSENTPQQNISTESEEDLSLLKCLDGFLFPFFC